MRYASVCDGISAVSVAWRPLGWTCSWVSEIDPFACAVIAHRFPDHHNLGDMLAITKETLAHEPEIDLLVGGTPCQSFSVAGLRKGMDDPRGNLSLRFVQLADVLRPRWVLWENVPGVLSSGSGRDFGAILGALAELGYGWAYRILDAQHFGVPQRRRRVFVVGYRGDWRRAAAVLFDSHCLGGHPAPGSKAEEVDSSYAAGRAGTVSAKWAKGRGVPFMPVAFTQNQRDEVRTMRIVGALSAEPGVKQQSFLQQQIGVRRFTPMECERLQGFPDQYTLVPFRGKPASDTARYKAIGNSMAVDVMRWIGRRMEWIDLNCEVR